MVRRILLVLILVAVATALIYSKLSEAPSPRLVEIGPPARQLGDRPIVLVAPKGGNPDLAREGFLAISSEEDLYLYEGEYVVRDVVASRMGAVKVVIVVMTPGNGRRLYKLEDLGEPPVEVYAALTEGEKVRLIPLARIVRRSAVVFIRGEAKGCVAVEAYAYKAAELYNESKGPDPKLRVARAWVSNGEFEIRLDLTAGPEARPGKLLVSENRVLLIYGLPYRGQESSTWISLEEVSAGEEVEVRITCSP